MIYYIWLYITVALENNGDSTMNFKTYWLQCEFIIAVITNNNNK